MAATNVTLTVPLTGGVKKATKITAAHSSPYNIKEEWTPLTGTRVLGFRNMSASSTADMCPDSATNFGDVIPAGDTNRYAVTDTTMDWFLKNPDSIVIIEYL